MSTRVQESPFRETEWDQRLDRMLDDLKTTVGGEAELTSADVRSDSTLVSSFRSTSRNEGRSSSRGGSRSGSALGGVEDGGHMRHTRREYRSPDNTHVVTEKYEYDTGDTSKSSHYQKKVMKSTYSNYNSMSAGSLEDPPHLAKALESPPQQSKPVNTKVISASQKVANKLVDALATIGGEEGYVPTADSSDTDTLATDTMKTSKTVGSDYSTLGRLRKNINELDSLIDSLEESQQNKEPPPPVEVLRSAPPEPEPTVDHDAPLILEASDFPPDEEDEEPVQPVVVDPTVTLALVAAEAHSHSSVSSSSRTAISRSQTTVQSQSKASTQEQVITKERSTAPSTTMTNGSVKSPRSNKYDGDDEYIDESKSGEVRRIVWRNRFEKTYETQDSSQPPVISIEEEARRRQLLQRQQQITSTSTSSTLSSPPQRGPVSPRLPQLQCAVYWPGIGVPPNMSPGGQSWKEPIPLPTPPQLSPREPGVAYIYTYGNTGGTGVQPLPPLNYVTVPGPSSVPPSEGAPSPTPSQLQGQPIIYHYSYHYTIQPGQTLPDGAPPPPGGIPSGPPPALQVASPHQQPPHSTQPTSVQPTQPSQAGYPSQPIQPSQPGQPGHPSTVVNYSLHSHSSSRSTSSTVNRTDTSKVIQPGGPAGDDPYGPSYPRGPRETHGPGSSYGPGSPYGSIGPKGPSSPGGTDYPKFPTKPYSPNDDPDRTRSPHDPGHPGNISITINKTTRTRTTHTGYPGEPNGPHSPGDVPPVTSTPYPSRGRSVSPEPVPGSNAPQHVTYITHVRSTNADSLERVRRPKNETLPFPDTSPVRSPGDGKIPRRVDDLMNSFSDSEDGPGGMPSGRTPRRDPADEEPLLPHNNQIAVRAEADAKATAAADATSKRELSKNKAGPPVYYPPGHELFHETMHTMTLKESGRRGKAKWRMERASGYKESSSSSETKGGVAMVPVCLPLCCGAACVLM